MGGYWKVNMKNYLTIVMLIAFTSCASLPPAMQEENKADRIQKETLAAAETLSMEKPVVPPLSVPEFVPVKEGISPLSTKRISIAARRTPLRDVLYTIAETANLNVVMEQGVNPEIPVTASVTDISVEDGLKILFDSTDYFHSIKDNILIVKAIDTKIFEFGQPNVIQEYKTNIGGDILGGMAGEESTSSITGEVGLNTASDKTSFEFWNSIDDTLKTLIEQDDNKKTGAFQPSFIINRMTGTIMVTATKRDLERVSDYISNLKKVLNRQVIIEARIVEVQLSEGLKYGIDWNAVIKGLDKGVIKLGTSGFTDVIGAADPHFDLTITYDDNFSAILKALQEQGSVNLLSNPRVNIMNGQTSVLSVGRNTTFLSSVETTTTTAAGSAPITTFTVETNSVLSGMILGLVPYINSEGEIVLTITPILSNLVDLESQAIGTTDDGENALEIKFPIVDLRELSTTVKVLDGQMIILGGLIDKQEIEKVDKIPLLGDIPYLGEAFKSVEKTYDNKELVIMLIPRIVS
jgi:MSHA type pilus biogenesis protein MshL